MHVQQNIKFSLTELSFLVVYRNARSTTSTNQFMQQSPSLEAKHLFKYPIKLAHLAEHEGSLQPVDTATNYEPDESIPLNFTLYKVRSVMLKRDLHHIGFVTSVYYLQFIRNTDENKTVDFT